MDFSSWDGFFNLLIAVFWFGAWGMDSRYAYFNSYLRPICNKFEAFFSYLRPAFPKAPDRAIALIVITVLLALRALVAPETATWELALGFGPAGVVAPLPHGPWTMALVWSCLSIGLFFLKFWLLVFLYLGYTRRPEGQVQTALHALTAPFSWIHPIARPPVLIAFGIVLGLLLQHIGSGEPATLLSGARALLAVVAAWVALLGLLRQVVFVAIVGHWIGMGTGAESLRWMCSEWVDHLIGPLCRHPVRVGMFDVTPWIFVFALWVIQKVLIEALTVAASLLP